MPNYQSTKRTPPASPAPLSDYEQYVFLVVRREHEIRDEIERLKGIFDTEHMTSLHPLNKAHKLPEWIALNVSILPYAQELSEIDLWRRRTHGREGDSRPVPLHS